MNNCTAQVRVGAAKEALHFFDATEDALVRPLDVGVEVQLGPFCPYDARKNLQGLLLECVAFL